MTLHLSSEYSRTALYAMTGGFPFTLSARLLSDLGQRRRGRGRGEREREGGKKLKDMSGRERDHAEQIL